MIVRNRVPAIIVALALSLSAQAGVKRVPAQYPTIQAAVNAASNGDVVRVAEGNYFENVVIENKRVSLVAEQGPDLTVINANHQGRAVTIVNAGSGWVTVSGFALINGHNTFDDVNEIAGGQGGAILALDSNVRIVGNVMSANGSCLGMALRTGNGGVVLKKNRIEKNVSIPGCSINAVHIDVYPGMEFDISENVISDHTSQGLSITGEGKVTIANNIFRNNDALNNSWAQPEVGGLLTGGTDLTLRNNLFVGNTGSAYGGASVGSSLNPDAVVLIQGNSFSANEGQMASGLSVYGYTETSHKVTANQFAQSGPGPSLTCEFPITIDKDNVFTEPVAVAVQGSCNIDP
jgi:hypothetical protein